ncbi:MAG: isoprenylcysteine carboxylmethyltransferase family protein [Spirochaetales bacterium]|nr:isoprenylcysteine carboxylmethyltransferase family protein [Spirochaetales bacterium]
MQNRKKIFSYSEHEGRKDLAGEASYGDTVQAICFLLFLIIWILDSFVFKISTFLIPYIASYIRIPLSIVFFITGGVLAYKGLHIVFGEVRETPVIIDKNVFGIIRHPIYLAAQLLYIGMSITTLSIISFIAWIPIFIFYNHIASVEEQKCIEKYGNNYVQYMKRVGKWIPKIAK